VLSNDCNGNTSSADDEGRSGGASSFLWESSRKLWNGWRVHPASGPTYALTVDDRGDFFNAREGTIAKACK
jgi:hypothetical protein